MSDAALEVRNKPIAEYFQDQLRAAAENLPHEIAILSEFELFKTGKIKQSDWFLRKNAWKLYEIAQKTNQMIEAKQIYEGVVSHRTFYDSVLKQPHRVAWLLTKPSTHQDMIEEAAAFGLMRLRDEVLTMPVTKETAGVIMKAVEFLANRAWGPVVQRIEAKHAHIKMPTPQVSQPTERLEELKNKLLAAKDVTPGEGG